jgi:hypothetical protein
LSFSLQTLKDGSYNCIQLQSAGYTVAQLKSVNFSIPNILTAYTLNDISSVGYTLIDLSSANIRTTDLFQANYSVVQLKSLGYSALDLKNGGFPDPPEKPSLKLLTIPGNISSAKLVEQLAENNGNMAILTIETEIDAFTNMFTSPFGGDNAMMLRKIFHNENISVMRKTNSEHLEAENPKMALLLTGTPIQISSLFKNNKDGLNSRFIVLSGAGSSDWKDVQPSESSVPLDEQFEQIGNTFYAIYHHFKELEIEIKFSEEQWAVLNKLGAGWLERCIALNEEFAGIAKRHVNMITRVASTLTVIRSFEQKQTKEVIHCADIDFKTAVGLLKYSFESALDVFTKLPEEAVVKDRSDEFFNLIPESFKRKEIAPIKNTLGVSDRWIDRMLVKLVSQNRILNISHGNYEKQTLS